MKRVAFISHSTKDKATAESICRFLESNGIPCWIAPRDVTPGKNYGVAIVDAIDECGVLVLILSSESNKSGQVVREVERAASGDAVIIPVRVEAVQPSRDLEFYVSSSHWLDATEKPIEKHLGSLVDAIRNWQSKHESHKAATAPAISSPPPSAHRANLPFLIGRVILAVAVIGFAIFLANRPKSPSSRPASIAASPTAQANAPRMGRRQAGREQTSADLAAASPGISAAEVSTTGAPNENLPPGPPPIIDRITASSARPPVMFMGAMRHFEGNQAFDGDLKTSWHAIGSGPGEWIEVFFKSPTAISSVSIFGGSGADPDHYSMNNRVHELKVTFPNGGLRVLTLDDKMEFQTFKFPRRPVIPSIKFEIVSIYRGNKSDATPIAEIQFNRPE